MNPFEDCFPAQALNIKKCTQLSDEQKKDFFDAMSHADKDKEVVKDLAENYFRGSGRKLCGESVVLTDETHLGRMHEWKAIEDELRKCTINGNIAPAQNVLGWKKGFLTDDSTIKRKMFEEVMEALQGLQAEPPPIIWAFLFKAKDGPFAKENFDELPCRLGLEDVVSNEYLPMELKKSLVSEAKKPTAFDAELYEYLCPGGRTCPRDECSGKNGFEEVVMGGQGYGGVNLWSIVKAPTFI